MSRIFPTHSTESYSPRAKPEHRSIAQEVIHLLSAAIEVLKTLSIRELSGLGKAHWKKVDAAKHVENERGSWD